MASDDVSMSVGHLVHVWLTVYNATTSSTGTVQKWSPGRHIDKPDGSKRHFGWGRPDMHESGCRNSATHGTRRFLGHVHRRVVNSQQDVNKMSDGHRNVVIR